jgi:hypothetical protein
MLENMYIWELFINSFTPWWKECQKIKKYAHRTYPSQMVSGY